MIDTMIENFTLDRIGYILKKKIIYIILFVMLFAGAGMMYAEKVKVINYSTVVTMGVYSDPEYVEDPTINMSGGEVSFAIKLVESYQYMLKSDAVLEKVKENLDSEISIGGLKSMINTVPIEDTVMFSVIVVSQDPYFAKQVAEAIAKYGAPEMTALVKAGGVKAINTPELPSVGYPSLNPIKYALAGGGLGGVATLLIFLFFGLMDGKIRSKKEIESTFSIPVLGEVMVDRWLEKMNADKLILHRSDSFRYKEAYKTIRTKLAYSMKETICPVIGVVNCDQRKDRSRNAINIAISFAQMGKKTLLIDCDLREPSIQSLLHITNLEQGLSEYLISRKDEIKEVATKVANLSFLDAGHVPDNPSELLYSESMCKLMETVKKQYDIVVLNLSSMELVSDAAILSDYLTSYIVSVTLNYSKMKQEKKMILELEQVNADICGIIINDQKEERKNNKKQVKEIEMEKSFEGLLR